MTRYSVSVHGFLSWHAEVLDEEGNLLAQGELTLSVVRFTFQTRQTRYTMVRHGAIRRWYQLLDEKENILCYSLPAVSQYSLTLYDRSKAIRCKVDKKFEREAFSFSDQLHFFDDNGSRIASMESISEGLFSQKSVLQILKSPSDKEDEIVVLAAGLLLFDYRDLARTSIGG